LAKKCKRNQCDNLFWVFALCYPKKKASKTWWNLGTKSSI
jgi:hypothetical protein